MTDIVSRISRRALIGAATLATASAHAETRRRENMQADVQDAFARPKQIEAGVLNVGYVDLGASHAPPVLLLHGWPYDIYSFAEVAPLLVARGYRVIVPYLRGYGSTRFVSSSAVRNAQQAALAADTLALMDALHIQRAVVAGFDWGARTAVAVAALWPARCKAIVPVSGYILANLEANRRPLPPRAELGWWYQYYFATERGHLGYAQNTHEFGRLIWEKASPTWHFDDETFNRSAAAFDNPDHADIVVHNYRWRLSLAEGEARYADLEARLQQAPVVTVPTITIGSDFDGAAADGAGYRSKFSGPYEHRVLAGIGHNVPQEAPQAFADAVIAADQLAA
ncbi:MAG: alpha/beta hydrolase [Terricaulis silvestris]